MVNNIELEYGYADPYLLTEIYQRKNWHAQKISARYNIPLSTVNQIVSDNYQTPEDKPSLDVLELYSLAEQGLTYKEIAQQLNTTIYYIRKAMGEHNIRMTTKKLTGQQYQEIVDALIEGKTSNKDLAYQYNVDPSMISHIKAEVLVLPNRKKHNKIDPALVVKLIEYGFTQEAIAKQLDISQATVSRLNKEHK